MYQVKWNPMPFIEEHCKPHSKLQAALAASTSSCKIESLIDELQTQQNPDGGFPGRGPWTWIEKNKNASATSETAESLYLFAQYGIDSEVTRRAAAFLINLQREDGGWAENPELGEFIPDDVRWISSCTSVPWMTGVVAKALLRSGHREWDVELTTRFLLETQDECGTWPYLVGEKALTEEFAGVHKILEALLLLGLPKDHQAIQRLTQAVLRARSRWETSLLYASSALNVFRLLEYEKSHEHVRSLIKFVINSQRRDGSWGEKRPDPEGTAQLVQLLGEWGVYYST